MPPPFTKSDLLMPQTRIDSGMGFFVGACRHLAYGRGRTMIAFEVTLNGKRVCVAGAEDLSVLSTIVHAGGKLGRKTVSPRPNDVTRYVEYSVGGLTSRRDSRKDVHLRWKSLAPLKIGDVIEVRILETEKVDRATSRTKAKRKRA